MKNQTRWSGLLF